MPATHVTGSLSPSRAGDFMTCPLLYRFRTIDRIPEPPSPAMVRGTLIHAVLERLFDDPAPQRTLVHAVAMVPSQWGKLLAEHPELHDLFEGDANPHGANGVDQAEWLAGCAAFLDSYFRMEDPQYLEPDSRELKVSHDLESGLTLRGIVDRIDVAPDGRIRVVDYKTGKSPNIRFEDKAMFQMKFYALVIWRMRGVMPSLLQLMYLGDGQFLRYEPDEADLLATERKLQALWAAIAAATEAGDFQPRPNALCGWCSYKAICPAWGGTPPPMPVPPIPLEVEPIEVEPIEVEIRSAGPEDLPV
ncbi:MAG: PD-(D/E)XK nuclease family protein [Actinomycetota bacterium]|nr:PD-(D/E)XK nuclease family protein [Actinomycetota bacterium]